MGCFDGAIVARLGDLDRHDVVAGGGKGASLSDMARAGLPVPPGFVVCTEAFRQFLTCNGLDIKIRAALQSVNVEENAQLEQVADEITRQIESQEIPSELCVGICEAYAQLGAEESPAVVAVRSSAAAEDSSEASFAGQQETYLNLWGADCILEHVRSCWGSFFHPRAIFYRAQRGNLFDASIAVVVQRMVVPDKSGVMFSVDPVQRRRDRIVIEATWGLGEALVSGLVTPDHYTVSKIDGSVLYKFVPPKPIAIVRQESGIGTRQVDLNGDQATAQVLDAEEIAELAALGVHLENHFGKPQDVEWAIEDGKLYLLQSRPVTTM